MLSLIPRIQFCVLSRPDPVTSTAGILGCNLRLGSLGRGGAFLFAYSALSPNSISDRQRQQAESYLSGGGGVSEWRQLLEAGGLGAPPNVCRPLGSPGSCEKGQ